MPIFSSLVKIGIGIGIGLKLANTIALWYYIR